MAILNQQLPRVSRRGFFAGAAAAGAGSMVVKGGSFAALLLGGSAVIGFHNDAPWFDSSGRDLPYVPPRLNHLPIPSTEDLLRLGHYL